jgi:hypothetical protein
MRAAGTSSSVRRAQWSCPIHEIGFDSSLEKATVALLIAGGLFLMRLVRFKMSTNHGMRD